MADPLSVAASAAGLISLGIQVCGGVQSYLDALNARDGDLRNARQHIQEFRNLLDIIQDQTDSLSNSHVRASRAAQSSAETCLEQMKGLEELVVKLAGSKPESNGLRQRMHDKGKQLMYPFHRPTIEALETRLDRLNGSLQVALQVLSLGVTSGIDQKVTEMHTLLSGVYGTGVQMSVIQHPLATNADPAGLQTNFIQENELRSPKTTIAPPSAMGPSPCSCATKRSWSLSMKRFGYWGVYSENSSFEYHIPGCKYGRNAPRRVTQHFGLEYTGLVRMLDTAVRLSLCVKNGTEGYQIGPLLTFIPTVDESTAPVFKILDSISSRLHRGMYYSSLDTLAPQMRIDATEHCITEVLSLFTQQRASPKATDSKGRTAMHALVDSLAGMREARIYRGEEKLRKTIDSLCERAVSDFIQCGVPAMRHDIYGDTPATSVMLSWVQFNNSSARRNLASTLIAADENLSPVSLRTQEMRPYFQSRNIRYSNELFYQSSDICEASGCGPLSLAVIKGDRGTIVDLLKRQPSCIHEKNIFGQTPLHLATRNPEILALLVNSSKTLPLDERDTTFLTPLGYACEQNNAESASILIQAGSPITRMDCDGGGLVLKSLLRGLKERRDELKILAIENLLETESKGFGLFDEKNIDYPVQKVLQTLKRRGVDIPTRLEGVEICLYDRFMLMSVAHMDLLWDCGFRDVNKTTDGRPAILRWWINRDGRELESILWLLQHGADTSAKFKSWTTAHFLSKKLGEWWGERTAFVQDSTMDTYRSIINIVLSIQNEDGCYCFCSERKCTPLTTLLKSLCVQDDDSSCSSVDTQTLGRVSNKIGSFLTTVRPDFSEADHEQAIRIATFEALGCRHTCCTIHYSFSCSLPGETLREEIDEINSEQTELLDTFKQLVNKLWDMFTEDKDGEPLGVADPEEFWGQRWLPTVEAACEELDSRVLTTKEIEDAEELGVEWTRSESLYSYEESEDEPALTFDSFRQEIAEIMKGA